MDAKLFESLAKYAGLAGISIGLILVIFRAILQKNIFPKLNTGQAYDLIRQLMYLTFIVGIVGIFAWAFVNSGQPKEHSITGHVTDKDTNRAVSRAEVTLGGRPESARTDAAGNFILEIKSSTASSSAHLYVSKDGYEAYDHAVTIGQNLDAALTPVKQKVEIPAPKPTPNEPASPPVVFVNTTETYPSDNAASGACKDLGAWTSVCTPDKPGGWTITYQHFELTGDRAGCQYAVCEPVGTPTDTKICYHFRTQGHDEECGHSGNTGIHYSKGILTVVWKHPEGK